MSDLQLRIHVEDVCFYTRGYKFFAFEQGNPGKELKVKLLFIESSPRSSETLECTLKLLKDLHDSKRLGFFKTSPTKIHLFDKNSRRNLKKEEQVETGLKPKENLLKPQEKFPALNPNFFFRNFDQKELKNFYEELKLLKKSQDFSLFEGVQRTSGLKRFIKEYRFQASDPAVNQRFFEEVEIMKKFDHLNIVHIFEVFQKNDFFFIVFEFCEGGSLLEKMQKVKNISEREAVGVMKDLTAAVKALHDLRVVNAALKVESFWYDSDPGNEERTLKLVDFSQSMFLSTQETLNIKFLSSYYTAPESIRGQTGLKVDVWNLGVILYLLLAGRPPFFSRSQELLFQKILTENLTFPDNFSAEVKNLLSAMLQKDPENRFSIIQVMNHDWFKSEDKIIVDKSFFSQSHSNILSIGEDKNINCCFYFIANHLLNPSHQQAAKKLFKALDVDQDGVLSTADLHQSREKFDLQVDIESVFTKIDLSEDQKLSFSDFFFGVVDKSLIRTPETLKTAFETLQPTNQCQLFFPLHKNFPSLMNSEPSEFPKRKTSSSELLTLADFLSYFIHDAHFNN